MHPAHRYTVIARLGPEVIPDPDFNDTAFWTEGAGWAVANGVATATTAASGAICSIPAASRPTWQIGDRMRWVIEVASVSAGAFALSGTSAPWAVGAVLSVPGKYTGIAIVTSATGDIAVRTVGASTSGTVTRFSVRKILG